MTDAAVGSATAPQPDAGIPNAAPGSVAAPPGSGSDGAADVFAGLDTGIRDYVGKHGIKDVSPESFGKLAKIAVSAESLIGKSVQIPDDKAKPEDLDKFFNKLGRPEKPEGYEFKLPEGIPEGMPYDAEFAKAFKAVAHKAGATAKQAAEYHDFTVKWFGEQYKAQHQKVADLMNGSTAALEKLYGPKDSQPFKNGLEMMDRTIRKEGLEEELRSVGLLGVMDGKSYVTHPKLMDLLGKYGKEFHREGDAAQGSGGGVSADNPFKDGPDAVGQMTAQHAAIKANRAGAIASIKAAGRKPSEWGLPD